MRTHRAEVNDDQDAMVWAEYARCAGVDPDVLFPVPGQTTGPAKAFCRACPARSQCLEWALETQQKHGVWGGMTASQRRRLRRAKATASAIDSNDSNEVNDSNEFNHFVEGPAVRVGPPRHLQLVR